MAVLHRLGRVGDLQQLARGGLGTASLGSARALRQGDVLLTLAAIRSERPAFCLKGFTWPNRKNCEEHLKSRLVVGAGNANT